MYKQTDKQERKSKPHILKWKGFTLAELLICLAILGVIAAFTIPKVLMNQQNAQKAAGAKEAASAVAAAFQKYQADVAGTIPTTMSLDSLLPNLNYVKRDTVNDMDDHVGVNGLYSCSWGGTTCLTLHNGMTLFWNNIDLMGNTNSTNGIYFFVDPDSTRGTSGNADGPSKSICFVLYANGRLTSRGNVAPNSSFSGGAANVNPGNFDPSWFSW